ncbi:uncharacterized protein [Mycetomoellerius zeteki]|nr:PREDICTED: uncharacterized protein LOC108730912 [Trachymyrmex zeteki]
MPTIRQIVDCLVATHPIRACGSRRLLLSAIKSNRATNDFNQDTSMVTSNNNNESVESYQNTRNPYHDHPYI